MRPGQVVGDRFEIERLAATGGMGSVYRALDRYLGVPVALKVLRADAEVIAGEARALAELEHPHVVRYVASGRTGTGDAWLAMEWLDGESLASRLGRGRLDVRSTVRLGARVASALAAAHERGVLHRDLSPSNLVLCGGDPARVKIVDFGLARVSTSKRGRVRSAARGWGDDASVDVAPVEGAAIAGTPGYMAPEQARVGQPSDERADLFSLGAVLYECLAGRPVVLATDVSAALAATLLETPEPLSSYADVPAPLAAFVHRLLEKDPNDRPSSAAEVASALEDLLGELDRSAPPPPASLGSAERTFVSVVLVSDVAGHAADVAEVAAQNHARVEQLSDGSAVLVFAGGTEATPNDGSTPPSDASELALRAAATALLLRDRVRRPIAIATGRSEKRDRVGEALDRAARLIRRGRLDAETAKLAPAREPPRAIEPRVWVDAVTAGLVDRRFVLEGDEDGAALVRARVPGEGSPRRLLGRPSCFVGRGAELDALVALFERCRTSATAAVAVVTGPAGQGKSRLVDELARNVVARAGARVLRAAGDPIAPAAPLGLVAGILRSALGLSGGEGPERALETLLRRLDELGPDTARRARGPLAWLLGLEAKAGASSAAEPQVVADRTRGAWEAWIVAEANARPPLLVVADDVQWSDVASASWLASLPARVRCPVLVVLAARPDPPGALEALEKHPPDLALALSPLDARASADLVRFALEGTPAAAHTDEIVARGGGNPFFLEELVRAQVRQRGGADAGPRAGQRGGRTKAAPDPLPESAIATCAAEIAALDESARRVLRAASIFGSAFWAGGVAALTRELGGRAEEILAALERAELVRRRDDSRFPGDVEYAFRHEILREAAYATLTDHDRAIGHRLAAEWLEAAGESDPTTLAEHLERGTEPERAAVHFARAAEQALAASDLAGALERCERAASNGARGEVLGSVLLTRAEAHRWRGEFERAEEAARAALERVAKNTAAWYRAMGEVAIACGRFGKLDELEALVHELVLDTSATEARVVAMARVSLQLSFFTSRIDLVDRLLEALDVLGDPPGPVVRARISQAKALRALTAEDLHGYLDLITRAIDAFEEGGDDRNACMQRNNRGFALMELGRLEDATADFEASLAVAPQHGLHHLAGVVRQNLGQCRARLGRVTEGVALCREAARALDAFGDRRLAGSARCTLAVVAHAAGELEEAEREARAAVVALRGTPNEAQAHAAVSRILLDAGRIDAASEHASEAMRLLDVRDRVAEGESLVRLSYVEALLASGHGAAARAALTVARDRLLVRAGRLRESWRADFLDRVPENRATMALAGRLLDQVEADRERALDEGS